MLPMISSIGRKPKRSTHQQAVGHDRGHDHSGEQRHVEQQRKPDGAAEKLGEIGRHGGDLADDPHRPNDRPRKLIAAHFREVAAGDDAELGRQRLEQHRDHIGEQHHPEQAVAVLGPGLDVGGEVARIHIGDRGDHRRAGEGRVGRANRRAARPGPGAPRRRCVPTATVPAAIGQIGHVDVHKALTKKCSTSYIIRMRRFGVNGYKM